MPRLKNKVALITGAAQGIGLGIAQAFINEGAAVILTDINDELGNELGNEQADMLGEDASYIHLDVCDEQRWVDTIAVVVKEHDKLDIFVNNAGITGFDMDAGVSTPPALKNS